ncbi:MAG TPA: A/G-specific adenine glycosylase [Burkholderiaceae bacterium]|nr:A/G-specific adenine glycosylase [Burkholderiaceae bacterium]
MSRPGPAPHGATDAFPADAAPSQLSTLVVAWQRRHGRHGLPWQATRDPYRVWLSEVMLQQTQVTTVLAYYGRFLERFPDVQALARAPLDDVLAAWSGLGYYSRARNLHRCAQCVVEQHGGRFPNSAQALSELPGIGRSTAAAIAAFCFEERAAILDGNVKRVLARVLAFDGDLATAANERDLWRRACELLPHAPADMPAYTQGLMDLGATLCLPRQPDCATCPLRDLCEARARNEVQRFPIKTRRIKRGQRENWWLWLEHAGAIWLEQRPAQGVWAGLWSLPLFESAAQLDEAASALGVRPHPQPMVSHALTHFDWLLHPRRAVLDEPPASGVLGAGRWVARPELGQVALPAPLRRLLG